MTATTIIKKIHSMNKISSPSATITLDNPWMPSKKSLHKRFTGLPCRPIFQDKNT